MLKDKTELLAPAGDLEKLKTAIRYGADAVYFGGEMFSLRAGAGNLSLDDIEEGLDFAHERGARGYMTLNVYPHNDDIPQLRSYIENIAHLPIDAFIVSDPSVIALLKDVIEEPELHLSTQANTTNYMAANFWASQGISRIVAAREMSLAEIAKMREELADDVEIEAFVHGAMCISYSGRCLLSNFMAGRDANKGECTHPCRWKYALEEEKRPGEYYPIEEDEYGTYILNSRDLCMLDALPDLISSGVRSLKIEGRMKSAYYVATVVSAYRALLDEYEKDPAAYVFDPYWFEEMCKASHREFTHGFYYAKPTDKDQNYITSAYTREYTFVGLVEGTDEATGLTAVEQRNKFSVGDTVEIFGPGTKFCEEVIEEMYDGEGQPIESAPHPQQKVLLRLACKTKEHFMIRRKNENTLFG